MHLAAAVIRAHIGVGYERNDKMRIGKVRGYALLPLAADLYPLVVPYIIASAVHIADDGQNGIIVGMRIAYEYVRFIALVGLKVLKVAHNSLLCDRKIIAVCAQKCNYKSVNNNARRRCIKCKAGLLTCEGGYLWLNSQTRPA